MSDTANETPAEEPAVADEPATDVDPYTAERMAGAFAGDIEPAPPAGTAPEWPALEGKLVEVRYTGEIDELEVDLPNGDRAKVKSGGYLKTTKEHADALAASDAWKTKGGKD